ncbi:sugar O-acetyltransferase [Tessaracoccus lubricantis]|uniref:Sugar O-acetyltransferase n=1 Tax=Tessaracoccus lubricantis TaxID=545543 RepID=A0ABP9F9M5_9ACTN
MTGKSNWQRMVDGELYIAEDPHMAQRSRRAVELADAYHRAFVAGESGARGILADLVGTLGDDAFVRPPLSVDYGEFLHIGARTFINCNLTALDVAVIRIGADCQIGPNVQLLTPWHPIEPGPRRDKWESGSPITLEDNVWLGGGVIVLPGVTIGENSIVGAGSVVTKDVPPGIVVAGNPARVIREL